MVFDGKEIPSLRKSSNPRVFENTVRYFGAYRWEGRIHSRNEFSSEWKLAEKRDGLSRRKAWSHREQTLDRTVTTTSSEEKRTAEEKQGGVEKREWRQTESYRGGEDYRTRVLQ